MEKLVEEVQGEGLMKLMGERITLFCANYIYTGKLIGVNSDCVLLQDAIIVYETGAFALQYISCTEKAWKDMQPLPYGCYVMLQSIESFMVLRSGI